MLEYFAKNKVQDRVEYQVNDFMFRWKKLERLVSKEGQDGLLIITGLDGKESKQTVKLFNWLFLGLSGKSILTNQFLDQVYSQIIVFVSKAGSHIFISPEAHKVLEGFIYGLPNLRIFCPTDAEYMDKDKLDIIKISNFYSMLKGSKNIAVLVDEGADVKVVEKWPLIQSYALEQVGGSFFTMKFNVTDLAAKVANLYKNHDKYSLEVMVEQNAKRIAGHIYGGTRVIEYTDIKKRGEISEEQINEPLKDAIEILEIDNSMTVDQARAKVLIGSRTNDSNNISSADSKVKGQGQAHNFHFTIEYWDPTSELRVCRTYFLGKNLQNEKVIQEKNVEQADTFIVDLVYAMEDVKNPDYHDQELLVNLYTNLIQGTLDGIVGVTKDYRNLNIEFIRNQVYAKLKPVITVAYGSQKLTLNDVKVDLLSYNTMGELQKIDFKDIITFKLTPHFHVLRVQLLNIQSVVHPGKLLGGLVFSQSFVLQEGCYMLLTKQVPYFNFWNCDQKQNIKLENLKKFPKFQKLGSMITDAIPNNRILVPTQKLSASSINIPIMNSSYYFHDEGIRIYNERLGWFVVLFEDMKNACMVNRMESQWLLFQSDDQLLFGSFGKKYIAMEFKGKAFELLMNRINQKENGLPVSYLNEMPPVFTDSPFICKELLNKKSSVAIVHSQIVENSFLYNYLQAKQLMILNNMKDLKLAAFKNLTKTHDEVATCPTEKYQLLIINGTYGAGKTRTAQYLIRYTKDYKLNGKIFSLESQNIYSRIELPAYMEMLQDFSAMEIQKGPKDLLIVVLPFWIPSKEFLEACTQKYFIRSVVTKINAANFYATRHFELTQHVLTYTTPGYTQSIILDTYMQDETLINRFKNILWRYNNSAKLYRVINNSIQAGVAKDIVLNNKFNSELEVFNRQKYAVYYDFGDISKFQIHFIEFKLPINSKQGFQKIAEQDGYLYSKADFDKQLEVQRTEAEKSKDQLLMTLYSITENIAKMNRQATSMRVRYAKGVVRVLSPEGKLEIIAANQFYKSKQVKQEPEAYGIHLLSIGYSEHDVMNFLNSMTLKNTIFDKLQKPRNIESVSKEQKKQLERNNRDKLLDNGEFFDGYFFRDVEGHPLREHPAIDKLVQAYIQEQNATIAKHNESVKQEWQAYQAQFAK